MATEITRVSREGEEAHAMLNFFHWHILHVGEKLAGMFDGIHPPVCLDELDEFLLAEPELQVGFDFPQLALVVVDPGKSGLRLLLGQGQLNVTSNQKDVQICKLRQFRVSLDHPLRCTRPVFHDT